VFSMTIFIKLKNAGKRAWSIEFTSVPFGLMASACRTPAVRKYGTRKFKGQM